MKAETENMTLILEFDEKGLNQVKSCTLALAVRLNSPKRYNDHNCTKPQRKNEKGQNLDRQNSNTRFYNRVGKNSLNYTLISCTCGYYISPRHTRTAGRKEILEDEKLVKQIEIELLKKIISESGIKEGLHKNNKTAIKRRDLGENLN